MPETTYNYSIQNDFGNLPQGGTPNLETLEAEIQAEADIDQALAASGTSINGDTVSIPFVDALSVPGKTALDTIVANHTGVPLVDTPQRTNEAGVLTENQGNWTDAAELTVPAIRGGNWQVTWYCEISVQNVVANSGVFVRLTIDGVERAFSSSGSDQYQSFSGSGLATFGNAATPEVKIQFRQVGAPNTAQIRRRQVALILED